MSAFTVKRTKDYDLVTAVIRHKKIYPHLIDDFSPPSDQFRCPESDLIIYLEVRDGIELLGAWMLLPISTVLWELHSFPLPTAWGQRTKIATRAVIEWLWENTSARRLVSSIAECNRLALVFAKAIGMSQYGVNPDSFQRGGKLHNYICMGVSRPAAAKAEAQPLAAA